MALTTILEIVLHLIMTQLKSLDTLVNTSKMYILKIEKNMVKLSNLVKEMPIIEIFQNYLKKLNIKEILFFKLQEDFLVKNLKISLKI